MQSFINNCYLNFINSIDLDIQGIIDLQIKPFNIYDNGINSLDILLNSLFFSSFGKEYPLDDLCMMMGNDERYLFVLYKIFNDNDLLKKYDYILIDTPPSSNIITQSAFLLSDYLIIPTIMDELSVDGVLHYDSKIRNIYNMYFNENNKKSCIYKSVFKRQIEFLGIFETMRKGNTTDTPENAIANLKNEINKKYKDKKIFIFNYIIKDLESVVYRCKDLKEVIKNVDVNVGEGEGRLDDIRGYNNLCKEIIERLNN